MNLENPSKAQELLSKIQALESELNKLKSNSSDINEEEVKSDVIEESSNRLGPIGFIDIGEARQRQVRKKRTNGKKYHKTISNRETISKETLKDLKKQEEKILKKIRETEESITITKNKKENRRLRGVLMNLQREHQEILEKLGGNSKIENKFNRSRKQNKEKRTNKKKNRKMNAKQELNRVNQKNLSPREQLKRDLFRKIRLLETNNPEIKELLDNFYMYYEGDKDGKNKYLIKFSNIVVSHDDYLRDPEKFVNRYFTKKEIKYLRDDETAKLPAYKVSDIYRLIPEGKNGYRLEKDDTLDLLGFITDTRFSGVPTQISLQLDRNYVKNVRTGVRNIKPKIKSKTVKGKNSENYRLD